MNLAIFEKFEPKKDRGVLTSCQVCGEEFGILTREHQCKRCFRAICARCGETRRDVYKLKMNRGIHKICDICKVDSDYIINYIAVNKLVFGEDSDVGIKWHKKFPIFSEKEGQLNVSKCQYRRFTVEIFHEVWDSYNYSFRQMIGLMTYNMSQNDVYDKILKVYEEIERRGVNEKIENIIFLIIFMLCFTSEKKAADLIKFLFELKKKVTDEKKIVKTYLKALNLTEEEMKKINDYMIYKLKVFIKSFSVNMIPAQSSIYILIKVFERKKIGELCIFFSSILNEAKKNLILNNQSNKSFNDLQFIRNCDLGKIIQQARLLASVDTSPYIRSFTSQIRTSNLKSPQIIAKEEIYRKIKAKELKSQSIFIAPTFKKIKKQELNDVQSLKKISRKQIDDKRTSPRKIYHFYNSNSKINFQQEQKSKSILNLPSCVKCREKDVKIKQIEEIIEKKNLELQNLKQNCHSQSPVSKEQTENTMQLTNLILKLQFMEHQVSKNSQKNESLFHELTKQQKQNAALKLEVEETETTNKILKNKIQSTFIPATTQERNTQKQHEAERMNELLQKTLVEKNKRIEQLMKKNKILSYQTEKKAKKAEIKNSIQWKSDFELNKNNQNQVKQLMNKMQQISEILVQEQKQQMQLTDQLFQLKQSRKDAQNFPEQNFRKQNNSESCIIF